VISPMLKPMRGKAKQRIVEGTHRNGHFRPQIADLKNHGYFLLSGGRNSRECYRQRCTCRKDNIAIQLHCFLAGRQRKSQERLYSLDKPHGIRIGNWISVNLYACFLSLKPPFSLRLFLPETCNHVYFVTSSYHAACHFVGTSASGHFGGVKVLMEVNDTHE